MSVGTRLEGRCAVVTGGGSGIGRAVAIRLAQEGARLFLVDVRPGIAAETAKLICDGGGEASWRECDVGDEPAVEATMRQAIEGFDGRLDILVTSAGIGGGQGVVHELTSHDWEMVLRVNLSGTFLSCKYAILGMLEAGEGSIVTIASVAGVVISGGSSSAYKASKAGVIQLTRQIAVEYVEDGIRANCVCPGLVRTNLGVHNQEIANLRTTQPTRPRMRRQFNAPMARASDPSEIASVVAFLASDDASFVTGAAFMADGGYTAI